MDESQARRLGLDQINGATLKFIRAEDNGRVAFEAYIAIHRNLGHHILIGAPSLEALKAAWNDFDPDVPINEERIQKVVIVKAK